MSEADALAFALTEEESTPEAPYSTNVRALHYFEVDRRLVATFKDGSRYEYEAVPYLIWNQLKAERSTIGKVLHRLVIRGGPYAYRKMQPDEPIETRGIEGDVRLGREIVEERNERINGIPERLRASGERLGALAGVPVSALGPIAAPVALGGAREHEVWQDGKLAQNKR